MKENVPYPPSMIWRAMPANVLPCWRRAENSMVGGKRQGNSPLVQVLPEGFACPQKHHLFLERGITQLPAAGGGWLGFTWEVEK